MRVTCVRWETAVGFCPLRSKRWSCPGAAWDAPAEKGMGFASQGGGGWGLFCTFLCAWTGHGPAGCWAPGEGRCFQHSIAKAGLCSSHQPGASLAWEGSEKAKSLRTSSSGRDRGIDEEKSPPDSLPWGMGTSLGFFGSLFPPPAQAGCPTCPLRIARGCLGSSVSPFCPQPHPRRAMLALLVLHPGHKGNRDVLKATRDHFHPIFHVQQQWPSPSQRRCRGCLVSFFGSPSAACRVSQEPGRR